jgi:ABC-type uncharacterized transport system permease subunit
MIVMVFIVLALLAFLVGTVNVQPPGTRQINWTCAGLALLTLAYLVRT